MAVLLGITLLIAAGLTLISAAARVDLLYMREHPEDDDAKISNSVPWVLRRAIYFLQIRFLPKHKKARRLRYARRELARASEEAEDASTSWLEDLAESHPKVLEWDRVVIDSAATVFSYSAAFLAFVAAGLRLLFG